MQLSHKQVIVCVYTCPCHHTCKLSNTYLLFTCYNYVKDISNVHVFRNDFNNSSFHWKQTFHKRCI